jgi:T-complex protein 1 subunit theta
MKSLYFELLFFFLFNVISALKKMVVNHIDKTFVTSDAATILKELEVQHPAAKMLQMACKMQ